MIDINQDYLEGVVDEETFRRLCNHFKGCRISFNTHSIEHREIAEKFNHQVKGGAKQSDIIRALAMHYEKSERQIRRIVKKYRTA